MPSAEPISGFGVFRVETVSLGGTVKERVMAARRGVFRSGVHGVVGYESDMAVRKHAAEWDVVGGCCSSRDSGIVWLVRGVWPGTFGGRFARPMPSGKIQAQGM